MAVPLRRIQDPRWTKPVWALRGSSFRLVLNKPLCPASSVLLEREGSTVRLQVHGERVERDGVHVAYECAVPVPLSEGLYDLAIVENGRRWRSPNSVAVCSAFEDIFCFLHATDLHLLAPGGHGALVNRSSLAEALVRKINRIRPNFVLYTGDLISRYGVEKAVLSPEIIWWQVRRVQEILLGLKVPVFVTRGNHDVAFESSRSAWRRYMGWPWDRATDDYSFDYGEYHFTGLDGFVHYDEIHGTSYRRSFTPEQHTWLEEDLHKAASSRLRVLFFHYDYQHQIESLVEPLAIDMLFYGHSKQRGPDRIGSRGAVNANLSSAQAYRVVRVEGDRVSSVLSSVCGDEWP